MFIFFKGFQRPTKYSGEVAGGTLKLKKERYVPSSGLRAGVLHTPKP